MKPGYLSLKKVTASDEKLVKLCPENYSLEGAEYGIYGNSSNAKKDESRYGTLKTKADGTTDKISLTKPGTYYIKETKAPKGYKLDETDYGYGKNGIKKVTVHAGKHEQITMKDEPMFDPMRFTLKKKAAKGADKNLSTAGAKYTVKYYKDFLYIMVQNTCLFRIYFFLFLYS